MTDKPWKVFTGSTHKLQAPSVTKGRNHADISDVRIALVSV
jgi:hypothetical protein